MHSPCTPHAPCTMHHACAIAVACACARACCMCMCLCLCLLRVEDLEDMQLSVRSEAKALSAAPDDACDQGVELVQARLRLRSRSACRAAASNTRGCSLQRTGLGVQPATKEPCPTLSSTLGSSVQLVSSSTLRRCGWPTPRPVSKTATRMPAPVCPRRQSACPRVRAWLCACMVVHGPSMHACIAYGTNARWRACAPPRGAWL